MGPVGSPWGTEAPPGGATPNVAITDHTGFGRKLIVFQGGKIVLIMPKKGYYVTRIYGPPGFTSRVDQQAEIGKKLGIFGFSGTCQTFCSRVLGNAGAYSVPVPVWSSLPFTLRRPRPEL